MKSDVFVFNSAECKKYCFVTKVFVLCSCKEDLISPFSNS